MGDHTIRTNTTDAYDAVAIAEAPSNPMGQKRHNAAVGDPTHESPDGDCSIAQLVTFVGIALKDGWCPIGS